MLTWCLRIAVLLYPSLDFPLQCPAILAVVGLVTALLLRTETLRER